MRSYVDEEKQQAQTEETEEVEMDKTEGGGKKRRDDVTYFNVIHPTISVDHFKFCANSLQDHIVASDTRWRGLKAFGSDYTNPSSRGCN
jgi:hypothetical protein